MERLDTTLLNDYLFEVGTTGGEHKTTVFAKDYDEACAIVNGGENTTIDSAIDINSTLYDLVACLDEAEVDIHDVVKTPEQVLIKFFGDDIKVNKVHYNDFATDYLVFEDGTPVFFFSITNDHYEVFSVKSIEDTFFANYIHSQNWFFFLHTINQISILIYRCQRYGEEDNDE